MSGTTAKSKTLTNTSAGLASQIPKIEEKNKQLQQETMMEKLRVKYRHKPKTYDEIKKSVRMYFIEKHYPLDPLCKATLQSTLDKLQHYIKVTSRHGLVERLESLSRQLGLKFVEDQQLLFISTDMFYVEILLDSNGNLSDVKVHHECKIEQKSSELANCLKRGDFADFTVQLEGLSSIYQLNAEPKVKKKAFVALQAIETDIYHLYQFQKQNGNAFKVMNNSIVGLVLERRGGHPMKLTYFCPPFCDHISMNKNGPEVVSDFAIEQVMNSPYALSATVNLEGSSANKLQVTPIVSLSRDNQAGIDASAYAPLTQSNSMLMPATYVLRLNKSLPVCYETLRALNLPLSAETIGSGPSEGTVVDLIVQIASKNSIKNIHKGLFVNLPKETHCYFFIDNRNLQGTLISSLPFTEPAQVPKIIAFLKKQALFYTLLSSCVREQQKQYNDMDSTVILEVTPVSFSLITVELQHPYEESLATVDFLFDDGEVSCTIYCVNNNYEMLSQKLTRTVQKVLSIPMVIYKLLKCWDEEHQQKLHDVTGTGANGNGGFGSSNSNKGGALTNAGSGSSGNFGQLGIKTGTADISRSFGSVNNLKMDAKVRTLADAFAASTSAAAAIAGLMHLKRDANFQATPHSVISASVDKLEVNLTQGNLSKSSEIDIADKYKNIWKDKTPNLKHCLSITPIPGEGKKPLGQQPQQSTSGALDVTRTGGIEIIPLNSSATNSGTTTTTAATTITITPITGKEVAKEKKASSNMTTTGNGVVSKRAHDSGNGSNNGSSSSNVCSADAQKEKKRRKKRDDSPMGPPEKIYSRQNSPAAVTESAVACTVVRKFSSPTSSPKGGANCTGLISGVSSGNTLSAKPSPKHSPVYSSPKHNTASNSPKSPFNTHSPKHSSSGKPSMSTLKNATAATSLSPKSEKTASSSSVVSVTNSANSISRTFTATGAPVATLTSSGSVSNVKRDKDKSSLILSTAASGSNVINANLAGNVASAMIPTVPVGGTTAASLKSAQQPQIKSSTPNISHLVNTANLNSYTTSGNSAGTTTTASSITSAMELNSIRKGLASSAVSLMTPKAALITQATAIQTVTIPKTATSKLVEPILATATEVALTATVAQIQHHQTVVPHKCSIDNNVLAVFDGDSTEGNNLIPRLMSTEYMIKPSSQEGLKLTINKTNNTGCVVSAVTSRQKSGNCIDSSVVSSTGTQSTVKKLHTGAKPNVDCGQTSKKVLVTGSSIFSTYGKGTTSAELASSLSTKYSFQKALGTMSSRPNIAKSGGVPLTKSNSTNSLTADHIPVRRRPSVGSLASNSGTQRQLTSVTSRTVSPTTLSGSFSQPPPRFDHHTDMMTILQYASPSVAASMEGFIKGLHNKFQIPKLSHRNSNSNDSICSTPTAEPISVSKEPSILSEKSSPKLSSTDISVVAASLTAATIMPNNSTMSMSTLKPSLTNDILLSLAPSVLSADGIDEELLASLAGE